MCVCVHACLICSYVHFWQYTFKVTSSNEIACVYNNNKTKVAELMVYFINILTAPTTKWVRAAASCAECSAIGLAANLAYRSKHIEYTLGH